MGAARESENKMPWLQAPIALSPPGGGGCCIGPDAMHPADIIVSTTRAGVSGVIRVGTDSPASHAALFDGGGMVIEAIGEGVVRRGLAVALADDVLAVVYRSPKITDGIASAIVAFAASQVGKSYDVLGAVLSVDPILCRVIGARTSTFFCSQLVLESYRRGGLPLTNAPSQCVPPAGVVDIAQDRLTYIGHLLGSPSWFPTVAP